MYKIYKKEQNNFFLLLYELLIQYSMYTEETGIKCSPEILSAFLCINSC